MDEEKLNEAAESILKVFSDESDAQNGCEWGEPHFFGIECQFDRKKLINSLKKAIKKIVEI